MTSPNVITEPDAGQAGLNGSATDGRDVQTSWLNRCVGDPAHFLATSWAKAPHVNRGSHDQFSDVFSLAGLSQLLAMKAIPAINVRMVSRGRRLPERTWADEGRNAFVVDPKRIMRLIQRNYTLIISGIDRFAPGLFGLCAGLQAELSHIVRANLYFTPSSSQGFETHFDDHDVIVLQLEGEKDWQVFDRFTDTPVKPTNVTLPPDQAPLTAIRLKQGDSLYLPRGFVHSAAAAEQSSLHASVGIYPATVADLLRHAVNEIVPSSVLARPLEPGFASQACGLESLLTDAGRALDQLLADPAWVDETIRGFCRTWGNAPVAAELPK